MTSHTKTTTNATATSATSTPTPPATITPAANSNPAKPTSTTTTSASDCADMAAKAAMRVFAAGGKVKDSMGREGTFRQWNRLADSMTGFHSRFEREFNDVYDQAAGGFHKHGMSLRAFLNSAQVVNRHLDGHHRIEEAYIFPLLAHKMPQFKPGRKGQDGEHIAYHRKIHEGLDKYDAYLNKAMRDQSSYSSEELRAIMDSLRKPLFDHLDEEVRDLGAGSMIRHGFTLQELDRVPM